MAWAVQGGRLLPRYATQWAYRTYVAADYPAAPTAFVDLFNLDDEYDETDRGWWHRSVEEIDRDVDTVVQRLVTDSTPPRWATETYATHIVELILPSL